MRNYQLLKTQAHYAGRAARYQAAALIFALATLSSGNASELSEQTTGGAQLPSEVPAMNLVSFGANSKLTVLPAERARVRAFYRDLSGCSMTKKSDRADFFKIGDTFYLGVIYDDSAQSAKDRMQSIWLELRTDHPEQLKQKILQFGIPEIQYWDKEHFYFQAPGGQVFRLAGTGQDTSK